MAEFGEENHRVFDALADPFDVAIARSQPSQLLKYNQEKQFFQLQGSTVAARDVPLLDASSVVVHIDGACRNNGRRNARAAYGVYFGPDSRYNASGLLDPFLPQTSIRAEIEALAKAVEITSALSKTISQ